MSGCGETWTKPPGTLPQTPFRAHFVEITTSSASMTPLFRLFVVLILAMPMFAVMPAGASAQTEPAAAETPSEFFAGRLKRMGDHVDGLMHATPRLPSYARRLGEAFDQAAGQQGGTRILLGLLICVVAGAALEWAYRRALGGIAARWHATPIARPAHRLLVVGIDAGLAAGAAIAFVLGALVVLLSERWPHPLNEAGAAFLVALVGVRLVAALSTVLLRPADGPVRHLAAFDLDVASARFWHRLLVAFVAWFAFGWALIVATRLLGLPRDGQQLLAYTLGIGLVVLALVMIWRRHAETEPAAAVQNGGKWLATVATVAIWLSWVAGALGLFWFLVVAIGLPLSIGVVRRAVRHLMRPVEDDATDATTPSVAEVLVEQGLRAALIVGALSLLLWGWGLDVGALAAQENTFTRLLRGSLHALIIVLVADLAWDLVKALADNALARAQQTAGLEAEEARKRARIRTLLPIGRNVALIVLVVMAGLMALSALGVEIAPLIASAGVVGVAVGFGAQTVVRDIISGMFYMLDDAFRIGEYIQSGNYKGTVESFSLRSIKLRHQRGPLYTIPFGSLGAVQNMSRDWVIVKDVIGITYDSDIDKAKKLIKQVGLELAKDPDLSPNILQPLKMQGVEEFGDFAIKIRTKMMTKPGEQFVIRRRANAMIKKAFDANGIRFAFPTVQVAGGGGGAAHDEAVSAAAQQILKPAANAPG
ncbi:MAG: mechanosensitive ion channel family protein [Enhydrobacter sp.]|nr:MAG: mechanosensitive ion channel family protein [Enhydrobacter sp.]